MDSGEWFWQHDWYWINKAMERYEQSDSELSLEDYTYQILIENEERNRESV